MSARQVHHAVSEMIQQVTIHMKQSNDQSIIKSMASQIKSLRVFHARLFWRCHFVQKLESQSSIEYTNQNREFDQIRSEVRQDMIQAWYD